jgi:1-acyl-sn-glycerol-3-phosphate acyltransferase
MRTEQPGPIPVHVPEVLPPDPALDTRDGEARALGRDPFEEHVEADPFALALEAFGGRSPDTPEPMPPRNLVDLPEPLDEGAALRHPGSREHRTPEQGRPEPLHGWVRTPCLEDIELTRPESLVDRLLDEDERRRLGALARMIPDEATYDAFGLSVDVLRRTFPIFHLLYRHYFRVQSSGHEHIPTSGPAILAGNHAGLLPFDASMLVTDIALRSNPPRLARSIVDHWAGGLPFVNIFFARVGQIIGTRENFQTLLDQGQLVLVFPEGMDGVRKLITQRYQVQRFRVGFIEQALRSGAPVIPTAVVGSDDQTPILFDIEPLAKALGLPVAPITPTFPWLGPLGLLPYPVRYRIVYGEPICPADHYGPEEAKDPRLVQYLAQQVRRSVQDLIDRHRDPAPGARQ